MVICYLPQFYQPYIYELEFLCKKKKKGLPLLPNLFFCSFIQLFIYIISALYGGLLF